MFSKPTKTLSYGKLQNEDIHLNLKVKLEWLVLSYGLWLNCSVVPYFLFLKNVFFKNAISDEQDWWHYRKLSCLREDRIRCELCSRFSTNLFYLATFGLTKETTFFVSLKKNVKIIDQNYLRVGDLAISQILVSIVLCKKLGLANHNQIDV